MHLFSVRNPVGYPVSFIWKQNGLSSGTDLDRKSYPHARRFAVNFLQIQNEFLSNTAGMVFYHKHKFIPL